MGRAVALTRQNADLAGVGEWIEVFKKDFEKIVPQEATLLLMNPPYDERLVELDINGLYQNIGDRLKNHFTGCEAWIVSSNFSALKHVGLRPSRKIPLVNGRLDVKFQKYE